ncbi:MAG: tRNA uridine-5-carboxymethylaminomethyl(34) synthesis GTPase MnmE [Eubacterium sp.]|nr:tRNA uridine-5-carboxymethylaminomethyl(34) synthesis GTPase MnmE [Eubacterium sp.]
MDGISGAIDCIAAISTPVAQGGVSMIRISGEDALTVAERVFVPKYPVTDIKQMGGYTAAYGEIVRGGQKLDDGILTVYLQPHSYTGENVAEITCHGGILVTRRVLNACIEAGARPAQAGEFTKRALLNGKLSLTGAEAVIDIINAESDGFIAAAKAQRDGALHRRTERLCEKIKATAEEITAWIDYPDEAEDETEIVTADWAAAAKEICADVDGLLDSFESGKVLRDGITAAIVGKPNAGKSTLMNLLSGTDTSIVTDIEGTTRDIVEETVNVGDIRLRLADCAGLRETGNEVEKIGVEKMMARLETARLIIAVFDGSRPLSEEDKRLIGLIAGKTVLPIINKSDLEEKLDIAYVTARLGEPLTMSAKHGEGLQQLESAITELCGIKHLDPAEGFIANDRQRDCVLRAKNHTDAAYNALSAGMTVDAAGAELEAALSCLYELDGREAGEEIIDGVFKRFCVGK